jgi:hypothetical protein
MRNPLVGAVVALALGIVLGVAGIFTAAAVMGQESPQPQEAASVSVLEYGNR